MSRDSEAGEKKETAHLSRRVYDAKSEANFFKSCKKWFEERTVRGTNKGNDTMNCIVPFLFLQPLISVYGNIILLQ